MSNATERTDEKGRAYAGSQLQVQIYVARRQAELSVAVTRAIGSDDLATSIRWTAPLEDQRFVEPYDGRFLEALELAQHHDELKRFWPEGGPRWDALAVVGQQGHPELAILVEAKSYPGEVYGPGCQASAESSVTQITAALRDTRAWLHASNAPDWTGRLYQYANHLAHLYFMRQVLNVPAWLVNLCFIGDSTTGPTTELQWRAALPSFKKELGFADGTIPYVVDVLLQARSRSELVGETGS
jgi:hypothetical protein